MAKLMAYNEELSGSTDNALNIKYGDTNVAEAIANVQNNVDTVGSFALANRVMISDTWQNRGYSKGEYAIYNNQLYVCILTHASAIVPTNSTYWKATWVGAELMPTTDIYYGTSFKVLKNGNVCTWILTSNPSMNADGITLSELIPSGYRPSASIMTTTKLFNGSSYVDARVRIYADGRIVFSDMWGVAISGLALQYAVTEEFTYVI